MRNSYTENIAKELPHSVIRGFLITGGLTALAVLADDMVGTGVGYRTLEVFFSKTTATQLRAVEPCVEKYLAIQTVMGFNYGVFIGGMTGIISGVQRKRLLDREYFNHFRR